MNHNSKLKVVKLSDKAIIPTKGSNYAAGYDVYSVHDYELDARGKVLVKTDIQIEVPTFLIKTGDRIAQLICEKILYADVLLLDSLDKTMCGDGGFGSTGVV